MKTMKTGRLLLNPFEKAHSEQTPDTKIKEMATASALSNMQVDRCPKCGVGMGFAFISNGDKVYYCEACRVTHPIPAE